MSTKKPAVDCSILPHILCSFYDRVCMYCIITYVAVMFHQEYYPSRKSLFQEFRIFKGKPPTINWRRKGYFPHAVGLITKGIVPDDQPSTEGERDISPTPLRLITNERDSSRRPTIDWRRKGHFPNAVTSDNDRDCSQNERDSSLRPTINWRRKGHFPNAVTSDNDRDFSQG